MIAATVLSAGDSVRMGSPKALLELAGQSFLQIILSKLTAVGVRTGFVVVGRAGSNILQNIDLAEFKAVNSDDLEAGPIGSLKTALRLVGSEVEAVLVWPVDMPHVKIGTAQALLAARTDRPIVVPTWSGKRGHPVLFKREIFQEILQLPAGQAARDMVRADESRVFTVSVDDPAIIESIDTPADYRRILDAY